MSKRERDDVPFSDSVTVDGSCAAVVARVFGMSDLVRHLVAVSSLTLEDMWHLYCTCRGTRRALHEDASICVFREARLLHHGKLKKPLKAALLRGDLRVGRALRAHVGWDDFIYCHDRVARLACGLSLEYVKIVAYAPGHGDVYPSNFMKWSLSHGNLAHFRVVRQWLEENFQPCEVECTWIEALRQGLPELALELHPGPDMFEVLPESDRLANQHQWNRLRIFVAQALGSYTSMRSLDWLAERVSIEDMSHLICFAPCAMWSLCGLRWAASYANRHGCASEMHYEQLYINRRDVWDERDQKELTLLKWLKPLAFTQFYERRCEDKRAVPLFGTHSTYTNRMHGLGIEYCKFPGLQDDMHYAYKHPENLAMLATAVSRKNKFALGL